MRALYITEPGKTEIRPLSVPTPGADEVLLRVRRVGLCGSDLSTFRGANPLVSYPRIPGHEVAATIEGLGRDVPDSFQTGMNVTLSPYTNCGRCPACRRGRPNACRSNQTLGVQRDGALTEFLVVPWRKLYVSRTLGLEELALVEPLTVGFHAVARGQVSAGETVAVIGCGAVGLGAVAAAANRGATVVAIDIDPAKLAVARRAGAGHVLDTSREPLHESLQAIAPDGPDVIIEAVGSPRTFQAAVEEVAFTGRVVYIGYAKAKVEYETKLFVQKELDIRGSRNALDEFASVMQVLEQGGFPTKDVITDVVSLDQAGAALYRWSENPQQVTRILVNIEA